MKDVFERLADDAMVFVPNQTGLHARTFSLERFAELIVRECLSISRIGSCIDGSRDLDPFNDGYECAVRQITQRIESHFGVEE